MNKHLFLFTIGPVKSFIGESRKTQDLYASSALLSHLCLIAIDQAEKVFGVNNFTLITPQLAANPEKVSIPNRFLAEVTYENSRLNEKANNIKEHLIKNFKKIIINGKSLSLPVGTEKQLEQHLDIRWVFYPSGNDFQKDFGQINKELAAIKNTNPYVQIEESGRKCVVDGKLNVKFYRETRNNEISINKQNKLYRKLYQPEGSVNIYKPFDEKELKIWQLQKGEGISAVTLKKRLYLSEPHVFPSTAYVSLMHLIESLKHNADFQTYLNVIQNRENTYWKPKFLKHSNDQLLYKENIPLILREEYGKTYDEKIDKNIKDFEREHEKWSKDIKEKRFTKYYALIRFDGDKMGDWFGGKFLKTGADFKAFQKQLSANIGAFSDYIQKNIGEPKGKVVYAGGEDFMAFVNLYELKNVVNIINCKFKEMVFDDELLQYVKPDSKMSLSMGIAIAHYKEPLQMVLDKAKKMEKHAKDTKRNRFSLRVSKHSGGQLTLSHEWNKFEKIFDIVDYIKNNKFSSAFLLNIYNFLEKMSFSKAISDDIVQSKAKLYITQAKNDKGNDGDIVVITNILMKLLYKDGNADIVNFADTLLIIDFIQRQIYDEETI